MQVDTVTTSDGTLLKAVRATLGQAEEAFMCVAFVHERGLQLLRRELEDLRGRKARTRLLVTTTFGATADSALALASRLGAEVRVLNPGAGRTFHPKLYLGQGPRELPGGDRLGQPHRRALRQHRGRGGARGGA